MPKWEPTILNDDFKRVCWQTCKAAYRLAASAALLALAVGLSLAVEWLIALAVPKDSKAYLLFEFVTEFCLIGSAAINAVFNCVTLVLDSWTALRSFMVQEER